MTTKRTNLNSDDSNKASLETQIQATLEKIATDLAVKVEEAESSSNTATSQGAVAEAYRDMDKTEQAMGVLETKLDKLLGQLDGLLEESEQKKEAE